MVYTIENEVFSLSACDVGAELWELQWKKDPRIHILWDGKEDIWPRRAPVCFPWCARFEGDWFEVEPGGTRFKGGVHGFVRDMPHDFAGKQDDVMSFRLDWAKDDKTWPWDFRFATSHKLEGNTVVTSCTATNLDSTPMPVQMGFHSGIRCPFVEGSAPSDYVLRFEQEESAIKGSVLRVEELSFDSGPVRFAQLRSAWVQLEHTASSQAIRMEIAGYPYLLLWSQPGMPGYICIEPMSGTMNPANQVNNLWERPGVQPLEPGQSKTWQQKITVIG